jgi:hypothetical protein
MSDFWLKPIGDTKNPWRTRYDWDHVDFATRPSVRRGDQMVLYAVGGLKRVFALVEVTSHVRDSGRRRWPYRVDIRYVDNVNVLPTDGVPIDQVSSRSNLMGQIQHGSSCIALQPEEYERAATLLRCVLPPGNAFDKH